MENELTPGNPRLGWFVDGDANTPEVAVMLQDTGREIVLTVPTKGMFADEDPYARWGMVGIQFGDDPDGSRHSYGPPRTTMFADPAGPVVLLGCRARAGAFTHGAGLAPIVANYAVLGARHLNYERINGMRSELPALAAWSGMRSVRWEVKDAHRGKRRRVDIVCEAPEPVSLDRRLNLTLQPTWRTSRPDNIGTFAAHDVVQLVTATNDPRPLRKHLELHEAMRDLLTLACWRRLGYSQLEVARVDGRVGGPRRGIEGMDWHGLVTHRVPKHELWVAEPRFLFTFDDIGSQGVRRWLRLRRTYSRTVSPLIGATADGRYLEDNMLQAGIALEALGYQLEVEAGGAGLNRRGQLTFPEALDRVLGDICLAPVPDPLGWRQRAIDCYKGVKHADNSLPDSLVLANTTRECLLVLRVWVASRLGVSTTTLRERLKRDPLSSELSLLE